MLGRKDWVPVKLFSPRKVPVWFRFLESVVYVRTQLCQCTVQPGACGEAVAWSVVS
jgi:hypothetical protein